MLNQSNGEKKTLKIGDILIKEGFITEKDLEHALKIQKDEAKIKNLPLGELFVEKKIITKEQLKQLLNHPYLKKQIGELAVEKELITKEQLFDCIKKKKIDEQLSDVLIREKLISEHELAMLSHQQIGGLKTGELAVKLNMITQKDLDDILEFKRSIRTLGEIFCDLNFVTPVDISNILTKYKKRQKIGDFLVSQGLIDSSDLKKALHEQLTRKEPIGKILISKNVISEKQLYYALSRLFNIPFDELNNYDFDENKKEILTRYIGSKYSEKNQVIPLSYENYALKIGISNPENIATIYELQKLNPKIKIFCVLITEDKFNELFSNFYGKFSESLKKELQVPDKTKSIESFEINLETIDNVSEGKQNIYGHYEIEAEQIVNYLIKYGILNGASDIHIEQDRKEVRLRYRIDGMLQTLNTKWLNDKLQDSANSVISRIKIISGLDIAERRRPQDGVFRIHYNDTISKQRIDLDFRVAVCPAIVGENITIRILDSRKAKVGLDNLGHSEHVLESFKQNIKSSSGIVLVAGPTGSGKSSTLYGALQYIYTPEIKIITVEDPIEYSMQGIMQTQIDNKISLNFAKLLRSFLRLDPDVILVGEIRDSETASIAVDAAHTGHMLLSSIHTNDAVGSIGRLLDLNIEYNQIASSLLCVLAQRLVRRICPKCKMRYIPEEIEWNLLFQSFPSDYNFYTATGCANCDMIGYKGRTLISENFIVNKDIAHALNMEAKEIEIRLLSIDSGMKTMLDDGLLKLEHTTLSEIIRVVPYDMIKEFKSRNDRKALKESIKDNDNSDSKYIIYNEKSDEQLVSMMYKRYQSLNLLLGKSFAEEDFSLFKKFIFNSFRKIRKEYKCGSVAFYIDNSDNKISIYATPVTI